MENYIKIKEFARALGISQQALVHWRISRGFDACIDKTKGVDVIKALKFLYSWKEEEANHKSVVGDSSDEKKYWDAQKAKIQVRQMLEDYIPKAEYLQTEKERLLIIKTNVLNLEAKLSKDFNLSPEKTKHLRQSLEAVFVVTKDTFRGRESDWLDLINAKIEVFEYARSGEEVVLDAD